MTETSDRARPRITAAEASAAVRSGLVLPLFQPIEALQTGACRGFEALARLSHEGALLTPDAFLGSLNADDRLCLFGLMLGESIAFLKRSGDAMRDLYVSVNVELSLIVDDHFVDILQYHLERYDFAGERLVVEILENEDGVDHAQLKANLEAVRGLGLSVALDDIGSGYASLTKIRDLPIDIFKLDRSFSRNLETHPEGLMFISSILSLARGLGRRMIAEGIETPEVYDALRIMGVEFGQGYAIAAPMPASDVAAWLARRTLRQPSRSPRCLLGAYASQLTVIESCRTLLRQPLPIAWTAEAADFLGCAIGRLFTERGWHDTAFGEAHRQFHAVLPFYATDELTWTRVAENFRDAMADAIRENPGDARCDPAGSGAGPAAVRHSAVG